VSGTAQTLTKAQLARLIRSHVASQLYDESEDESRQGTAIYSLSDPREIRLIRYVGQTRSPRKRFLQHLAAARLWLPDETPWWVKSPKLLPLYNWIRELHRDEFRLPVMVVGSWAATNLAARQAERLRIYECLAQRMPLVNIEAAILGNQIPLL
jgi:hypothetical protein